MEPDLACVDGQLVPVSQATIPITDPGLTRGDGVFEVIRLYGGRPYALAAHLARLERSAAGLRLPVDFAAVRADVATLLASGERGDELVRVIVTRGGRRIALIEPLPKLRETLALALVTYSPTHLMDGIKSLSYAANMLALRLAVDQGTDDALLVSPHGRVLECSRASFFLVRGAEIRTPPVSDHILDSITRRAVLAVATVVEEPISTEALAGADEAFVASTGHEVRGAHAVGEHRYPAPGPRTQEIAALVRERILAELP